MAPNVQPLWSTPSIGPSLTATPVPPTPTRKATVPAFPTGPLPPSLAAPTDLVATAASGSQITLTWSDNSGDEGGFKVERSTDGASFHEVATVGANVRTYASTGLSGNRWYAYRVRAYGAAADSAYSNTSRAKTPK